MCQLQSSDCCNYNNSSQSVKQQCVDHIQETRYAICCHMKNLSQSKKFFSNKMSDTQYLGDEYEQTHQYFALQFITRMEVEHACPYDILRVDEISPCPLFYLHEPVNTYEPVSCHV